MTNLLLVTKLEAAKAAFMKIPGLIAKSSTPEKIYARIKEAYIFLFNKRKELCQTDEETWPLEVRGRYQLLIDRVIRACKVTEQALKERNFEKKMALVEEATYFTNKAIKTEGKIRKILQHHNYTFALHKLK